MNAKIFSLRNTMLLSLLAVAACTSTGKKESSPSGGVEPGSSGSDTGHGTVSNSFLIEMTGSVAAWSSNDPAKWLDATVFSQIEKGDPEGAEQIARKELRSKPADPQAMLALAASLLVSRNVELADYYASRVVSLQTMEQASALNIRGICRVLFAVATGRGEDFDEASALFRKSLDSSGLQIAAALNLGEMELLRNRSGDSISAFNMAIERCNGCRPARYGLGLAAMRARQFEIARDQFRAIVKADPGDDEATYQLALAESYGFKNVDKAALMLKDLATGSKDIRVRAMAESVLRKLRVFGGAQ